jgi:hypothetical protein
MAETQLENSLFHVPKKMSEDYDDTEPDYDVEEQDPELWK